MCMYVDYVHRCALVYINNYFIYFIILLIKIEFSKNIYIQNAYVCGLCALRGIGNSLNNFRKK